MTRMTDQATPPSRPAKSRWRGWAVNILLIALVFGGVQWWKARPLAHGQAPALAGMDLAGQRLDLRDYRGEPVLVHFWASWCPVCRLVDGAVASIAEDHPVITVALQSGGPPEIRAFLREAGLDLPVIPDAYGEVSSRWGVAGVPATFVIDGDGQIRYATVGASTGPGLRLRLWMANRAD
ncbi:protein disulfide oxidoreductase [Thiorhodococcus minor]|nr:protein disulfide oxidoreductase [Thiorhodococcus minor]